MPGRDIDPAWSSPIAKSAPSSDFDTLVRGIMKSAKCTRSEAINTALADEGGAYLFKMQKRAEQAASGAFTKADMQMLDGIDKHVQSYADLHKRAPQSDFERMVADVLQGNPHLSESEAADHVRSSPQGMEAWLKFKGKPGQNGVPVPEGDTATTGRAPSQWHSPYSDSRPVTPDRTPAPEDETPTVKAIDQWRAMATRLRFLARACARGA